MDMTFPLLYFGDTMQDRIGDSQMVLDCWRAVHWFSISEVEGCMNTPLLFHKDNEIYYIPVHLCCILAGDVFMTQSLVLQGTINNC